MMMKRMIMIAMMVCSACEPHSEGAGGADAGIDPHDGATATGNPNPWEQEYDLAWTCLGTCDIEPPIMLHERMIVSEAAHAVVFWSECGRHCRDAIGGSIEVDPMRQCARGDMYLDDARQIQPLSICLGVQTVSGTVSRPFDATSWWSLSATVRD